MRTVYSPQSLPDPQRGRWQVYRKIRGYWLPIGDPVPQGHAEQTVDDILASLPLAERDQVHPHAVPL